MKKYFICLSAVLIWIFFACSPNANHNESVNDRVVPFDLGWKFVRDSVAGAEKPSYNDSSWRSIDLPHDWSIENIPDNDTIEHIGPFSKSSEGETATGQVKGGTGWYRKHFTVDPSYNAKHVLLCFDGVYMIANVWVNGNKAGNHFYGYTPFSFDIGKMLHPGSDNIIAVEVKNPGKNSRWYSGSGIYRHVWLTVTNPLSVEENGVFITTTLPSKDTARVHFTIAVNNGSQSDADAKVITLLTIRKGN